MSICPKCGNSNKDGVKFCAYCGNPLSQVYSQPSFDNGVPMSDYTADATSPEKAKKKKPEKSSKKIIIAMVAVLLVITIVLGVIYIPKLIDGKQEQENEKNAEEIEVDLSSSNKETSKKEDEKENVEVTTESLVVEGHEELIASEDITDDKIKNASIGDYITFGSYEQDGDNSNGKEKIEWIVLKKQDDKMLVISRYALDCKSYNEECIDVTWEDCTLRSWLNNDFLNSAFTDEEKSMIPTVTVIAENNPSPYYNTVAGNDTQDKVFLLSIDEVNEYFSSDSERECEATGYAVEQGVYIFYNDGSYYGNCVWWLRTPGANQDCAANVDECGHVYGFGTDVDIATGVGYDGNYNWYAESAVRPAMWINL